LKINNFSNKATFLILSFTIFVLYYPSLQGSFIFDDYPNIINNYDTLIKNLSFSSIWQAMYSTHGGIRPFAHLSFALNYYFFGLNPFYYHVINVAFHCINSFLVFVLLKEVSKKWLVEYKNSFIPMFGALFFAVATIQTSAVSYIVQRMALGMTLFALLSLIFFVKRKYVLSVLMWILALGFKENAALVPFIILLFLWVENEKNKTVFSVSFIVTFLIVSLFLFSPMLNFYDKIVSGYDSRTFTLTERLLTEPRVIFHYFSLIIYPLYSRFVLHYGFFISKGLFTPFTTFLSIFSLVGISLIGIFSKGKWLSFWILFIIITLSLESSIIPLDIAYEHRMYFPMVGVSALFGYFVNKYVNKRFVIVFVVIFLIFSGINTFLRNRQYHSYESILKQDFNNYPNNPRLLHNLFAIYLQKGEKNKSYYYLCKSLENNSFYYNDYVDFSNLIVEKSGVNSGIRYLKNVLRTKRKINKTYLILWKIAKLYEVKNDVKVAEQHYLLALQLQKKSVKVFRDYGLLLFKNGKYKEGYYYMKKAYRLRENNHVVLSCLIQMANRLNLKKDEANFNLKYNNLHVVEN